MPIKRILPGILILVFLVLAGCATVPVVVAPSVNGTVTDGLTGQPIAGAKVYYKEHPVEKIVTGKDGTFSIPEVREEHKAPVFLPVDKPSPMGTVVIEAAGYAASEMSVGASQGGGPRKASIEVHMKRR